MGIATTEKRAARTRVAAEVGLRDGAVTRGYSADREKVLHSLNQALATELLCVLRYKQHQFAVEGLHAARASAEFAEHAQQEERHANMIAARITQLGGRPMMSPDAIQKNSHVDFVAGESFSQMIRTNLIAERVAIDQYRHMIRELGDDPTTRRLLEEILAEEEEHADELASIMRDL